VTGVQTCALPILLLLPLVGHEEAEAALSSYEEHAAWFFACALLCFVADMVLGDRRRQRQDSRSRRAALEQTVAVLS